MRYADFRSDTVTQPTQQMRDAIYRARVGDDVFEDDPTVRELEGLAARLLGKEAALFVPSGTQGNAVCVMAHTRRGDAILLGDGCHISHHEAGSYAMLAGVSACFAKTAGGVIDPESVRALLIDDSELQVARTGLVCIENALSNGAVAPLENMREIYAISREKGVPVHLDGARLFNAALALGVEVTALTQYCDTVLCALSKGLCAPVGSVVAGSADFIRQARKIRKALGGGMRQAGFLAAAGLLALTEMPARLQEDHENARHLADRLAKVQGVTVDFARVQINMVFFSVDWDAARIAAFPARMLARGFKVTGYSDNEFRLVTNRDVTRADCNALVTLVAELSAENGG